LSHQQQQQGEVEEGRWQEQLREVVEEDSRQQQVRHTHDLPTVERPTKTPGEVAEQLNKRNKV